MSTKTPKSHSRSLYGVREFRIRANSMRASLHAMDGPQRRKFFETTALEFCLESGDVLKGRKKRHV